MADRNAQPSSTSEPDVASSVPKKEPKDEPQYQQTAADSSQHDKSHVRNSVLEAIANHQKKRISELERNLEKKRATIERLSATPSLPHPAFPIIPPNAMPAMPPVPTTAPVPSPSPPPPSKSPPPNPTPSSEGTPTNPPPPSHTVPSTPQPQPATSTAASNPIMAAPVLGFHPQAQLPPYPYMFPPPDPTFAAQYMGVMPPGLLHAAHASHAQPPVQAHQQDKANDGQEQKQSRYWTPEEHERFLAGMKACGPKNYMQIAEYVGTRNAKQVRTHAQKYQKRLEREEAKRRREMRHGRVNSSNPMTSVAADAAAAVKAAAAAAMRGNVPGISSTPGKDTDSTGTPADPSSSSSGKQCHSLHQHSQGASSGGSISANTAAERHAETSRAKNHSAAVAAISAEAKALGRGVLPPGAMRIASHVFANQPRPTMVNKNTGNLEDEYTCKASGDPKVPKPSVKREVSENSAPSVQKCSNIKESKKCKDSGGETLTVSCTKEDEVPTGGDTSKGTAQQECTETTEATYDDQESGKHKADTNDALHARKVKEMVIKREEIVDNKRALGGDDEQLSQKVELGKTQGARVAGGSVVHTRLTKTDAGHESAEIGVVGTVDGGTTVKHEPECVDSCTNFTDGREATSDSAAVGGQNDGANSNAKELRSGSVGGVEAEKTGGGGTRDESGEAGGQSHGADGEGDNEDGTGGRAGEESGGGEGRKRARDGEATTTARKRAKKGDGGVRKESGASEGDGAAARRSRANAANGGNSAAA